MGLELDFLIKGRDEASGVFDKFTGRVNTLLDKFPNLTRNLVAGAGAAYALSTAYSYVSEKTKELIDLASKKEEADLRLAQAMKTNLLYTKQSFEEMQAYAEGIKKTYAIEDEEVKHLASLLAPFGMTTAEIKKAIPAILDFAKAKDIDAASAANLFGKAYVGHVEMLRRMGIVLDATRVKTEGMDYIMGEFNKRFGGAAQADLDSYARKVKELGIEWDDLKKLVGHGLVFLIKPAIGKLDEFGNMIRQLPAAYHEEFQGPSGMSSDATTHEATVNESEWAPLTIARQNRYNAEEQAKRDHEAVMAAIDKTEKDVEAANLDGWGKRKAELEKQFDEQETGLREQGVKDFGEFEKKKTDIIEAEHAKWLEQQKQDAQDALTAWQDEAGAEADAREKALEDAGKKYDEVAAKYKAAHLGMKEVDEQLLKVIDEINKKYDSEKWQKGQAEFEKIVQKRVANAAKRDEILGTLQSLGTGDSAQVQLQKQLAAADSLYRQLKAMEGVNDEQLKEGWQALLDAKLAATRKYNDAMLAEVRNETGIISDADAEAQKRAVDQKYKDKLDYFQKKADTGLLTGLQEDQWTILKNKRQAELDAIDKSVTDVGAAAKAAGDSFGGMFDAAKGMDKVFDNSAAAATTANSAYESVGQSVEGLTTHLLDATYAADALNRTLASRPSSPSASAIPTAGDSSPKPEAYGGVVMPRLRYAKSGLLGGPTYFPQYNVVAGEAGPEAFIPLDNGKVNVGVRFKGGAPGGGDIHIHGGTFFDFNSFIRQYERRRSALADRKKI